MYKYLFVSVLSLLLSYNSIAQNLPFPNHTQYKGVFIKPSLYTQEQLDNHVTAFYDHWKAKYLINGCESNQYYVFFDSGNTVTVSEAMGYGFVIIPLMAGYDANAKTYFDGLYRYYKAHPSHIMPRLMAWKQITGCVDSDGPDSASDGDIDIAFGLLLAHAQWGSAGAINYFEEAQLMIEDMMGDDKVEGDINQDYFSVKLGDWVTCCSSMKATRTSDFITDHFRLFSAAVNDSNWNSVVDECYALIDSMQTNYSVNTGLLPDFIVDLNTSPRPADPDFLEGPLDGNYSYNACRDPWRLTNDYLINGDERAQNAVLKIASWLHNATGENINKVYAGYYLNGDRAVNWNDNSFTAPFTVGAMIDTAHQDWLNTLYSNIKNFNNYGGYYDNTLTLLSLITISGNYWVPDTSIMNSINIPNYINREIFTLKSTVVSDKIIISIYDTSKLYHFKIADAVGHVVWESESSGTQSVDISANSFKNGLYVIYAVDKSDNMKFQSEKFIVAK